MSKSNRDKLDKVGCILLQMKREIEAGREVRLEKVNQALRIILGDSPNEYNLRDFGFKDIHKQGFII